MKISPAFEDCSPLQKVNQSKNTALRVLCSSFGWQHFLKTNQPTKNQKKPSEICMMGKYFWEYFVIAW